MTHTGLLIWGLNVVAPHSWSAFFFEMGNRHVQHVPGTALMEKRGKKTGRLPGNPITPQTGRPGPGGTRLIQETFKKDNDEQR
jgi:hypothetical protein